MPFSRNAFGITADWRCAHHRTGPHVNRPAPFPSEISTRHRYAGDGPIHGRRRAIVAMRASQLESLFGRDASHRTKGGETHPTHWPAADSKDFPRVQFECARGARSVLRAIPGLAEDARRIREEGGL